MKHFFTLILIVITTSSSFAQLGKQDIDIQLLSEIIAEKQNEIKQRVLGDLVVNNIETSNYAVYNTVYNLVNIITTEKNKTVMTRDIVQQMADYAVCYGLTNYFYENELEITIGDFTKTKSDNKNLEDAMIFGVQKEQYNEEEDKQSDKEDVQSLLVNYLMDQMYTKLSTNYFLTEKGFFRKDPFRNYFTTGLTVDYTPIKRNQTVITGLDEQMNDFLNKMTNISESSGEIFQFIKADMTLKNFKSIKPEHIVVLLTLFEEATADFRAEVGKNSFIAVIGDIIAKYIILEVDNSNSLYQFEIDVESIILSLEEKFYDSQKSPLRKRKIGIQPTFTLGLNYGFFIDQENQFYFDPNTPPITINQIALGSEKIGLKFLFNDKKYTHSFEPMEWYQYKGQYYRWKAPQKQPVISNVHGLVYFSGILYNIVNLRSEENFDYPIVGAGFGIEFFNGLQANVSVAMPVIAKEDLSDMANKSFVNFGFDIPIFTYLKEMRARR